MAAPITHIVFAEYFLSHHAPNVSPRAFLVGTSFPDIRYLGIIDRETTHTRNVSFEAVVAVAQSDSFEAGRLAHCFLDEQRELYMHDQDLYDLIPESPYRAEALKLFEDELLYAKGTDWDKIVSFFNRPLQEERKYGLDEKDITYWHETLQGYYSQKPSQESRRILMKRLRLSYSYLEEIEKILDNIRGEPSIVNRFERVHNDFKVLITA